ncbi:hypothetical protein EMIT0196MI5_10180 [Pseudomonas sp. IT-196MI5]
MAFFVCACFVAPSTKTSYPNWIKQKPEIFLIPKLRPSPRPFAAIQRLFDLIQD